jgi:4-coumarate--CoA ligase
MSKNQSLIHKSLRPDLKIPNELTLTDFVLNSQQKSQNLDFPCFTDVIAKDSVSHSEVHQTVPKVASFLYNDLGISKGDVVLMFSPNHVNFGAIVLGIIDLGKYKVHNILQLVTN